MKQKILFLAALLTLSLSAVSDVEAQWVQTTLGNGYQVRCFAVNGSNLFAGTLDSGIFRSNDDGAHWMPVNNGLPAHARIDALAVEGTKLFAGSTDSGVFLSTDDGANWAAVNSGLTGTHAHSIITFAQEVSADGRDTDLFAGTAGTGVFLSTNGGANWSAVDTGLLPSAYIVVARLGVKVSNDGRDTILFAGTYNGFYTSTNRGENWTLTSSPFWNGIDDYEVVGKDLFVGVFSDGAFISTNDGATWTLVDNGLKTTASSNILCFAVNFSPKDTNLFAGTGDGVYLTTNNGTSWGAVNEGMSNIFTYSLVEHGEYLFAGTDTSGVWRRSLTEMISQSAVSQLPSEIHTFEVYPNPLTQSTTISFSSPESGVAEISVVNILGTEVARLFSGELSSGAHSFQWDASGIAPGIYECLVRMNGQVERVAMVVAR